MLANYYPIRKINGRPTQIGDIYTDQPALKAYNALIMMLIGFHRFGGGIGYSFASLHASNPFKNIDYINEKKMFLFTNNMGDTFQCGLEAVINCFINSENYIILNYKNEDCDTVDIGVHIRRSPLLFNSIDTAIYTGRTLKSYLDWPIQAKRILMSNNTYMTTDIIDILIKKMRQNRSVYPYIDLQKSLIVDRKDKVQF
jgi:hypothetical protein